VGLTLLFWFPQSVRSELSIPHPEAPIEGRRTSSYGITSSQKFSVSVKGIFIDSGDYQAPGSEIALLCQEHWRKLQSDLRKTPRDFDLAATLWDGPVLSVHLRRPYRVDLGVRQCQRLFRDLGFRLRKPRPPIGATIGEHLVVAGHTFSRTMARPST
jgi:hypothetical protein